MKYYLIVGEASGDLHASNLMRCIKEQDSNATFRFYGGNLMEEVGGTLVKHYKELAYMGFIPVLLHMRTIVSNMNKCKKDIVDWNPDVVILVDYPGFNLSIAKFVRAKTNIPVFYYISPKIWAWKEYRINNIKRDVTALFSILPFEVEYFEKKHNYHIHYVGNPCVDEVDTFLHSQQDEHKSDSFFAENGLQDKPVIALLPGSRRQEIKDNLEKMILAAETFEDYQLVIGGAPGIERDFYKNYIPENCNAHIVFSQTYKLLSVASAALVTSGTATLETALFHTPQVVCYYVKCGKFVSYLKKKLLKVPYVSLVNLIAKKEIVPELVADKMNIENIRTNLRSILPNGDKRSEMLDGYENVINILGKPGASKRVAIEMIKVLNKNRKKDF